MCGLEGPDVRRLSAVRETATMDEAKSGAMDNQARVYQRTTSQPISLPTHLCASTFVARPPGLTLYPLRSPTCNLPMMYQLKNPIPAKLNELCPLGKLLNVSSNANLSSVVQIVQSDNPQTGASLAPGAGWHTEIVCGRGRPTPILMI